MKKAIVLGASGGIGFSLVNELASREIEVVAFARNEEKLIALFRNNPFVKIVAGDVLNEALLQRAAFGAEVIFHAVSVPYEHWEVMHPRIMRAVLNVATYYQSKVIIVDNVYAYGQQNQCVNEETVKKPHTKKGKIRLQMEELVKAANLSYLIAHLPDFYGPNASNTMVHHTMQSMLLNKSATMVGSLRIPREIIFTPDGAKAIVQLALHPGAYNQNWNIPGERLVSGEELIQQIRELTGYSRKVHTASKAMIWGLGLFSRSMRELVEMYYLYEQPFQLDGSKYEYNIGPVPTTSLREGLKETINFYLQKERISSK